MTLRLHRVSDEQWQRLAAARRNQDRSGAPPRASIPDRDRVAHARPGRPRPGPRPAPGRHGLTAPSADRLAAVLPVHAATVRLFLHILGGPCGSVDRSHSQPSCRSCAPTAAGTRPAPSPGASNSSPGPRSPCCSSPGSGTCVAVHTSDQSSQYLTTLLVKLLLVGVSAAAAAGHIVVTRRNPAVGGAAGVASARRSARCSSGCCSPSGSRVWTVSATFRGRSVPRIGTNGPRETTGCVG